MPDLVQSMHLYDFATTALVAFADGKLPWALLNIGVVIGLLEMGHVLRLQNRASESWHTFLVSNEIHLVCMYVL